MKRLYSFLLGLAMLLSYSGVMAFESPSGYSEFSYTVDLSYVFTEPAIIAMPTNLLVAHNTALHRLNLASNIGYHEGKYTTYTTYLVSTETTEIAKPIRGYIKAPFSMTS